MHLCYVLTFFATCSFDIFVSTVWSVSQNMVTTGGAQMCTAQCTAPRVVLFCSALQHVGSMLRCACVGELRELLHLLHELHVQCRGGAETAQRGHHHRLFE